MSKSSAPSTAVLNDELKRFQAEWQEIQQKSQQDRKAPDRFYAEKFAPAFIPLFQELRLHGLTFDMEKPRALVSVLGLSWQPVALMAAWIKPSRMLILGTSESFRCSPTDEPVVELISRISGVPLSSIESHEVPDDGELEIYQEVSSFISKHHLSVHEVAIDPTGGKKSMSVSAGLVGFLTGSLIVYVDYAQYYSPRRIPLAGTEYPRLLRNPLEHFGHIEIQKICAAFKRGDYKEAEDLAADLAGKAYDARPANAYRLLARAYGAWNEFLFEEAFVEMTQLKQLFDRFSDSARWDWAEPLKERVNIHLPVLQTLSSLTKRQEPFTSIDEGIPIILNHLASACRALQQGRLSIAILVIYATMERYIDLCLLAEYGLDDEKPDYQKIQPLLDVDRYHKKGRILFEKYEARELSGPLMMGNGIQLLTALNPDKIPDRLLGPLRGLMNARNKSPYEHGLKAGALTAEIVEKNLKLVREILALCLTEEKLGKELERFGFPLME
jgi:hypothetical protein